MHTICFQWKIHKRYSFHLQNCIFHCKILKYWVFVAINVSKKIILFNHLSKGIKKVIKKSGKNNLKLILLVVNVMLLLNFINNLWSWIVQIKRWLFEYCVLNALLNKHVTINTDLWSILPRNITPLK